ncbi:DUF350 domain-containing protein [Candidatus Poribacteria bacterium]
MADAIIDLLKDVGSRGLLTLVVVLVAVWIGKLVRDMLTRYKINEELTDKNNAAVGVALMGYYVGLAIAIAGVLVGSGGESLGADLLTVAIYSVVAIILLNISALVNDKLILYKFDNQKELVDDRNSGTGMTMAGSYLATGLIVNAAVSGEVSGGWGEGLAGCLVFFALGQVVLVLAGLWYQLITSYDVHKVIGDDNNAAAGIGFGGFLFAIGYVVRAAMTGQSESWGIDLVSFALYVVIALILLTIGRFITDKVFLPKAKISDEIGGQGNVAAAAIAAAIYITIAVLIVNAV